MNVKANRTKSTKNVQFVHRAGILSQDIEVLIENYEQEIRFIS